MTLIARVCVSFMLIFTGGIASAEEIADSFKMPVGYPDGTNWDLNGGWGYLEYEGASADVYHPGEDLNYIGGGDCGMEIRASANGIVTEAADFGRGWGPIIEIKSTLPDSTEIWMIFGHVQYDYTDYVWVGKSINQGDLIGHVGSGYDNEYSCHLHLEVRTQDMAADNWPEGQSGESIEEHYENPREFIWEHETIAYESPVEPDPEPEPEECEQEVIEKDWRVAMVYIQPENENFDFDTYYWEDYNQDGDGMLTRTPRVDTNGNGTPDPIINNEGSRSEAVQWLVGDANDDGWDDVILIAHPDGQMKAHVWLSQGDGYFDSRVKWLETGAQYDYYLHGHRGKLLPAKQSGSTVTWYKCFVNSSGTGYNSCSTWGTMGGDLDDDVYLTGDFDGDNKGDVLRGYINTTHSEMCSVSGHNHRKLHWQVLLGSKSAKQDWLDAWGCPEATYVVGDMNGDGKDDIVNIRHDTSDIGKVFVIESNGTSFDESTSEVWYGDFGSTSHDYWVVNLNNNSETTDPYDDLVEYKDDSNDIIWAMYSDGSDFPGIPALNDASYDELMDGEDRHSEGEFLFGNFGLRTATSYGECE